MKKFVFATAMALVSLSLIIMPALRAQESGQITISDPAEFNLFQNATTQSDPGSKAQSLEAFLTQYPQSVAKKAALDELMDAYQQLNQPDKELSACQRLLQVDPNNMKAILYSVILKKRQGQTATDNQAFDDAAALAQKGLTLAKPADVTDDAWKQQTTVTYPLFHSAIAWDDDLSKKDYKDAIAEYRNELMLYPAAASTSGNALVDTLQLAEAYAKPDARDMVQACWFYARAWNFAPPAYKEQIEPKLEYWYKRFHGNLDGLPDVKTAAAQSLFPPTSFSITPAPTPPEIVHNVLATTPDLTKLNLEDKEFILANGSADDAQKLWGVLQNQATPVPGIVISDPAAVLKVEVTTAASVKPKEFLVKLTNPVACSAVPVAPTELKIKDAQAYILANGDKGDTDAMGDALTDSTHVRRIAIDPSVPVFNVAVTQDAKDNKTADFIVNMKTPVSCKDAPAAGFAFNVQPADELDATYDTYKPIAATATREATAQIVMSGGFIQAEKKAAPVHHKPPAGHHE